MRTMTIGFLMLASLVPVHARACGTTQDEALKPSAYELRTAPIQNAAMLAVYLETPPYNSPLLALSEASRKRFARSITFGEGGLTGFSYADIERELSVSQAYAVLQLIGSQRVLANLHQLTAKTDLDHSIRAAMVQRQRSCREAVRAAQQRR